jgi:hypothetical protein
VTDNEIEDAQRGFNWFLAFALRVMSETVESIREKYGRLIEHDEGLSRAFRDLDSYQNSDKDEV